MSAEATKRPSEAETIIADMLGTVTDDYEPFQALLAKNLSPFDQEWKDATDKDDKIRRLLVIEMLKRKWYTGRFFRDFWIFLRNSHPFFGMFLSHPLHSISQKERFWIWLAGVCFSLASAYVTPPICDTTTEEVCEDTCLWPDWNDGYSWYSTESQMAHISNGICDDYQFGLCAWGTDCTDCGGGRFSPDYCTTEEWDSYGAAMAWGGLVAAYMIGMKYFAACACCQAVEDDNCCKKCGETLSSFFLCSMFTIALTFGITGWLMGALTFTDFAYSQATSYFYSIFYSLPGFWWYWRKVNMEKTEAAVPEATAPQTSV